MDISTKKKWPTRENPISKTWKKIKSLGRTSKKSKNHDTNLQTDNNKSPDTLVNETEENKNLDTLNFEEEKSVSAHPPSSPTYSVHYTKSLSCPCSPQRSPTKDKNKKWVLAPQGCFTVYVGPERQRFVVRAKMVNHPLFQVLLEDAEEEFGYQREGPLVLPCQVSLFFRTLAEIESLDDDDLPSSPVCGLFSPRRSSSYHLLSAPSSFRLNDF